MTRSHSSSGKFQRTTSYAKQVPNDDEIICIDDVDIQLSIPNKLQCLDYPKVGDGHDEDVVKVIRKKFTKLGLHDDLQDGPAVLSGDHVQAGYISLQTQIEEAASREDDTFLKSVCSYVITCYIIHIFIEKWK